MISPLLQTEIDKIIFLYETTYPGHSIDIYVSQSEDPVPDRAVVIDGYVATNPMDVGRNYLGLVHCGDRSETNPKISVLASVPRAPSPGEFATFGQPSVLKSLKARLAFRASPLGFECVKFQMEMLRKKRRESRHRWKKIPLSRQFFRPERSIDSDVANKRPAILIGFHWLEHGGAEKLALDTVDWALEAGLRVFVVCELNGLHRLRGKLPEHEDLVVLQSDQYLPAGSVTRFLCNLIDAENIKAMHIHHCAALYDALPAIRTVHSDITVIDSTHIVEHYDGGYVRVSGVWSNFVDHHHVISNELAGVYLNKFQVRSKVVLGRLLTHKETPNECAEFSLEVGQKTLTVAFVGRMAHQKRPNVMALQMKALAKWAKENSVKLAFNIVGEGSHLESFKTLIARYGLSGSTTLYEANADVPAVLRASDILLLPSSNEGLALVCYEAIEQGTVPISSDVGAQNEIMPEALLTDANPWVSSAQVVEIVDTLFKNDTALGEAKAALRSKYDTLAAEPTAYEVLLPIYKQVASS